MNIIASIQGGIMAFFSFFLGIITLGIFLTLTLNHWFGLILGGIIVAIIGYLYGYSESIKKQEEDEIRKYQIKQARS